MCYSLFFCYAFYWGGYLRWNGAQSLTGGYNNADIMTIMFLMLVSTLSLGSVGTVLPSIGKARIAGKFAFDVIDHVPGVQINEPGKQKINRDEVKGKIEFENVCFNYPSNPDLKVLKNLTCTFESGKSIGLIGPSGSGKSTII